MAHPEPSARPFDFASYQNANPNQPLPGARLNMELNAIKAAIGEIIAFL